mgnify:CR=1 FL=1
MSCIRIFLIGASNNRGLVKGITNGFKAISRGDSFWRGANKGLTSSNVNGPNANTLNKGVSPTTTVEGVSDELLQWDPQTKVWYNPSTGINKTATFSIMIKSTDWNRSLLEGAKTLSRTGGYISTAGYALTLTVVGAEIGIPLSIVGNGVSTIGGVGEVMLSTNFSEFGQGGGFMFAQEVGEIGIEMLPHVTEFQEELLRQTWRNMLYQSQQGLNNR